jgi:xanthine dehydrogenase accessory factor
MQTLERVAELRRKRKRAALVTVTAASGSTPRKPGSRMIIFADGSTEGSIGGGQVEHVIRDAAARVLERREPEAFTYRLSVDLDMGCGGTMTFFVEPILTQPPLIVFGCGHVGSALIRAAAPLGFDIVAVDDLVQNANPERLPQATDILNTYALEHLAELPFTEDAFVVIVTREHRFDQQLLELCIDKPVRYLGVIGSPRKARLQRERLAEAGATPEQIERVRCPVGIDIGAETPEEIAIAICAELVSELRGGPKFESR